MKQSKFDIVMDHIDEHIQEDKNTIKNGIYSLIGIGSNTFGHYFSVLTGDTLGNYIRNRRLYFAAMELLRNPNKSICDIALDYGYSDQSAFTRAISAKYNTSPNEIRSKTGVAIPNERYLYEDFDPNPSDTRSDRLWREFERTGYISPANLDFLDDIQHGQNDWGFDIDTCYAIADLAEQLNVPVSALMQRCFALVTEITSDPRYISNEEMTIMELGIRSFDDLELICKHYDCKYYDLNTWMVEAYYKSHS